MEFPGRGRRDGLRGLRPLTTLAAAALALFALATAAVIAGTTRVADLAVTQALQSVASPPLDLLANLNTIPGQAAITIALDLALAALLWRRDAPGAWLAAAGLAIPVVVGTALKLLVAHPPPPDELVRAFWNPLGVAVATTGGYPSGHTSRTVFLALLAAGVFRSRALRIALAVLVALTLWARVYIGDHWTSDVVGGTALGAFAGALALQWLARCRSRARLAAR